MRQSRQIYETVATVNGFEIVRQRSGSQTYWHAIKLDADGFQQKAYRDLGTRREAEALARQGE